MLTLTSIVRADVRPSEATEIALRIERGDLSFHDPANPDGDRQYSVRHASNARERDVIVRALRAFV
jgi:hypothetical protein